MPPPPNTNPGNFTPNLPNSMDSPFHTTRRSSYAIVAGGGGAQTHNPHAFNTLSGAQGSSSGAATLRSQRSSNATLASTTTGGARGTSPSSRNMDVDAMGAHGLGTGHRGSGGVGAGNIARDFSKIGGTDVDTAPLLRTNGGGRPEFFTPSYLRRSRHLQKIKKQWEKQVAEYDVGRANSQALHASQSSSHLLATRQSNSSLNKMHNGTGAGGSHVHRGVVQDVVERLPPGGAGDEDKIYPLPSRWNEDDKMAGLEVLADGTEVRFNGVIRTSDEAAAIRADQPMPRECGLFYFEVTVLSRGKDGLIGIGFSGKKVNLARLPGWELDSWAYHGDDGNSFACTASGKSYGPRFSSMDVIGCGVNFRRGTAFFTKNGVFLGNAFNGIKSDKLYPAVGVKKPGEHLRVNFGKTPFVFDIITVMEMERKQVFEDINRTDITSLQQPLPSSSSAGGSEGTLVRKLVSQYLAHEGYFETSRALQAEMEESARPLRETSSSALEGHEAVRGQQEDDLNAVNRQKVRRAILDGDIDRALKYMETFYPTVLQDERNKDVYFRLRCRKFIEMMKRYSDLQNAAVPTSSARNGHKSGTSKNAPDTQMELDDQLHREVSAGTLNSSKMHGNRGHQHGYEQEGQDQDEDSNIDDDDNDDDDDDDDDGDNDVDMDASTNNVKDKSSHKSNLMKQDALLQAAINYGITLQKEFLTDGRPEVREQLSDIFAVMAYKDPMESVVGAQLDPKGRGAIAEEVNGAILVSLGKPSSAAIEKVGAWTEALLDEIAAKTGGSASFVSVQRDYLSDEVAFADHRRL